jgi:glutaredoxin
MLEAMGREHAVELQVFVGAGCPMCQRALRLAREVDNDYPQLAVQVVDIGESAARRDDVFAVPTFVLDGRVLSLGNPQRSHLRQEIESLLLGRGLV